MHSNDQQWALLRHGMSAYVAILDEQHCEADVPGTAIRHPSAPQNGKTRKPDFSRVVRIAALSILLGGLSLSASAAEPHRAKPKHKPNTQVGQASWYDYKDGRKTASGQKTNDKALTAAHRTMPFGSKLRVTNIRNGKSVIVVVNDRGPFHGKRIIDVNRRAAQKLGLIQSGVAEVRVEKIIQVAETAD